MKTATLEDLRTRLATIVEWVEQGEDVVVKGEKPAPQLPQKPVDWSQSAVFRRRDDEEMIPMSKEELQEFYQDIRGSY